MSKFFFSVFISVVLTSLETQLVLSKNPHHGEDFFISHLSLVTCHYRKGILYKFLHGLSRIGRERT